MSYPETRGLTKGANTSLRLTTTPPDRCWFWMVRQGISFSLKLSQVFLRNTVNIGLNTLFSRVPRGINYVGPLESEMQNKHLTIIFNYRYLRFDVDANKRGGGGFINSQCWTLTTSVTSFMEPEDKPGMGVLSVLADDVNILLWNTASF